MSSVEFLCIVPAAGSGSRVGLPTPKAFLPVGDETILSRTLRRLAEHPLLRHFVVPVPEAFADSSVSLGVPGTSVDLLEGGETRGASVQRAMDFWRSRGNTSRYVVVHDAARCMLPLDVVDRCLVQVQMHGAVSAAIPATDTLVEVGDDGTIVRAVNRETIWRMQTPQAFRWELLERGYREGGTSATDDASLVHRFHPVHLVRGDSANIKITTADEYQSIALNNAG